MFNVIRNSQGEKIDYAYHAGNSSPRHLVVIGHGVTGNKDRPFIVALAKALANAGISSLRISFSGNGESEGRFADSTISKEVDDLEAVIDQASDFSIAYVGHSMGAAVGVMQASQDRRIRQLVSLAGMVHTKRFAETEFGMVKPDEGNMWDDENCPLSKKYMDDLTAIESIAHYAPKIAVPWLLIHGNEDDVVPLQDSKDLLAKADKSTRLIEMPGANHVFAEPHTGTMAKHVVDWLSAQFQEEPR